MPYMFMAKVNGFYHLIDFSDKKVRAKTKCGLEIPDSGITRVGGDNIGDIQVKRHQVCKNCHDFEETK